MICVRGLGCDLDLVWLWLWRWLAAAALLQTLAWELPYATGTALRRKKKKKKRKEGKEGGKEDVKTRKERKKRGNLAHGAEKWKIIKQGKGQRKETWIAEKVKTM